MGLLTPLAVRIGHLSWMPRLLPQVTATDRALQRLTRGRVSILDVAGLPNITLTVVGRKSGAPRSTPLLAVPRGQDWLVAGSNFGGPKQPVWVVNLEANPDAEITVKGRTRTVRGRRLEGEERERAWQEMVVVWPNYDLYAERTDRQIKVFELTPR
ncbi:nitroreductase family deazaflavin-dependent oxidoreductase [Nocardioides caldifontis]|uniref:nitroreductase family deazaflavin-dependent oxidoreductase n=1 Tax=Nocardioides caldifontis TaxID=2588938 RepID=UPI0011E00BB9|nr:nitroreductase family deazaflavin-dependent oxidoreductase [Nocardioides caldifontis]